MLIEDFLPEYEFNEVHSIAIQAAPDRILRAVKALTPSELSPVFRLLFAIRSLPARLTGKNEPMFLRILFKR